ncbi:cell wall-binding repeat-containing protein [Paenisporosarcina sp. TG-14]|uniref:cell wall-binding repeat-containing protein n=1 Tax=Paenisporosarcina sp. TG-14 TaxID=1231057 RepID=UPI0002DF008F|nr:cell wall-binding repeat-containing protein [Paenisporosarcina sp. TG-14]
MKILLRVLMSTVLLMPVTFLLLPVLHNSEAAGTTFMDIKKITNVDVSTLNVYDDQLITTYRDYANQPALISSYSKDGLLNWEISAIGPHAITENKFATVDGNYGVLYIRSTATGEVLTTNKIVNFGTVSRIYMNENYIVLASKWSFVVYDTNGKFIMQDKADVYTGAALSKNTLVFQDSKGIKLYNLSTRQKMWGVPLESRFSTAHTLVPNESVIYAQGVERLSTTDSVPVKDVLLAINASTGRVLYKKDFGKYEETWVQVKEFGLLTSHDVEDIHNIYNADGTLKMSLNMESPAIKQLKQKNNISGNYYNSAQNFVDSKDGIYYFKRYYGVYDEYVFSSLKSLDETGAVKFEKVLDEHVFSIATTYSNKLFVANGKGLGYSGETNELNVYDSSGALLDTIKTEYIKHLQSDGSSLYGYGGNTLYIFKESEPKVVPRISGTSRYDTAVAISKEGWKTADTVVLATAGDFPDALAGGPLAFQKNAPILLTRTAYLTKETKAEIERLGAKKVIILGSQGAVSLEVEKELKQMGLTIERIGGKNRFDTAALIAQRLTSNEAVVAYGFNFPDVLSVSAYASKNGIPILLTRTDKLPAETAAALKSKSKTHVIGSTGAVGEAVFKLLPNPVRYGGKSRYDTGFEVNSKLKMGNGKAFIATGTNFPDALAGSVLAAKNNAPILLVKGDTIPGATAKQLADYESYAIFGGTGAVGEPVRKLLIQQLYK